MNDKQISWEQAVLWLRQQPEQLDLVRDCYYDDPLDAAAERFFQSEEWRAVRALLRSHLPGNVLDIGAGRGISSYAFAKTGCTVTALEPDESPIVGAQAIQRLAADTGLPITVNQEYGEELPFPDHTFDIVYGRAVLHHAKHLPAFCREAARVLKPGGIFLMTREHVISVREDLPQFLAAHPLHRLYGGEHAYLLNDYVNAIQMAGLQITHKFGCFETEMNYAPMSRRQIQAKIAARFSRYIGGRLGRIIASIAPIRNFAAWHLSRTSTTPGRHYSFLAEKRS